MANMPQEDWSDYASPTGPDTRQADMVSKQAVKALFDGAIEELEVYPSLRFTAELLKKLREQVKSL